MLSCDRCGSSNDLARRYCWSCGARVRPAGGAAGVCGRCDFVNDPSHHWCGGCGLALAADVAEWRQLTVMFCDLAGSTAMSAVLDPEDLREVNRAYQETVTAAIERFGGYVARYMGDGVLAYFGWPRAHEDDPLRAVRAGLAAVEAMEALEAGIGTRLGVQTRIRVGIATGRVVVGDLIGDGAAQEAAVVGETPNLAARLQGEAAPNQVVVAGTTCRRVGEVFELTSLGERILKGISEPVQVFAVTGVLATPRSSRTTPLVGRRDDLAWLEAQWAGVSDGLRVALIAGEAGIGKSHLVEAFVAERPRLVLQGSPFHAATALHPLLEHPWSGEQTRALVRWAQGLDERKGDPEVLAEELSAALVHEVIRLADEPVVLLVEDAQWFDPSTLDWLGRVIEQAADRPLMLLVAFRPQFDPPWEGPRRDLHGVGEAGARSLIHRVAEGGLPEAVVDHILQKTDGIPLFVEELTRALLDSGQLVKANDDWELRGDLDELAVPDTLQDSLMARLDQLGFAKAIAQVGAVIGRSFSRDLLAAVSGLPDEELTRGLERIVASRLAIPEGDGLIFRHALVQDTAYASLLRSRRRTLHGRIADALILAGGEGAERLAQHLAAAGRPREAARRWMEAAQGAANRFANREAIAHLDHALEAAQQLADAELEIEVRLALAGRARVLESYQLLERHLAGAQVLAEQRDADAWLAEIHHLRGSALFHQADIEGCLEAHERAWRYAEKAGSARLQTKALSGLGDAAYLVGRFATGRQSYQRAVEIAIAEGSTADEAANNGMVGWCSGFLDEQELAIAHFRRALELAELGGHARVTMFTNGGVSWWHTLHGDFERGHRAALTGLEVARKFGSANFEAMSSWYEADALLGMGRRDEARTACEIGLAICNERGGMHFAGAALWGSMARLATDETELRQAIARGEEVLQLRSMWSSRFWYRRGALQAFRARGMESEARAEEAAIRAMVDSEPIPLVDRWLEGRAQPEAK